MRKRFEKTTEEHYGFRFEVEDNLLFVINKCSGKQFVLDKSEIVFLERALEELNKQEATKHST